MAMALVLLHALLLASVSAAAAMGNATGDGSSNATTIQAMCSGADCESPGKPLPIYGGYPPPVAPSLPPAPPAPPSAPGSQTPCPPVGVVCCGGAGGQYMPQQPPPTGGYVPYYNASASPPSLLAPLTLVCYHVMVAFVFLLWLVV
ncbi:unnamed protein product [Urochloa decumbens]|uniref:Uncharacterized protein n=1 Tax=Urochloa decumbens TaxID=240449 RepID=A0ABC8XTQ9_9POAL